MPHRTHKKRKKAFAVEKLRRLAAARLRRKKKAIRLARIEQTNK